MNRSDTEQKSASGSVDTSTANTRLTGPWLLIARAVWLALVVPSLGLFVFSLLVSYQQAQTACNSNACSNISGKLPAQVLQALPTIGLSVSGFAALVTIFFAITAAIWYTVGFLIFWRRSDDWLALVAAFFLVMFNISSLGNTAYTLAFAYPLLALPLSLIDSLETVALLVFFLLFPSGRPVPRWMGLILLFVIVTTFLSAFPSINSLLNAILPPWLNLPVTLFIFGAIIFSQIYRYRRVSTPVQRQQTKWIILGLMAALGVALGVLAISPFIQASVNSNALGAAIFFIAVWPLAFLLIPLSIGFSILRYRLYDIDVLINRTLVYGTLTVLLALVYVGLVIGLQSLVRLFTGQVSQSPVVIVASTLAIVALFQPLRHRLQKIVDRRFYRSKYDATKIVEAFSATLRNEVDLSQLQEHLLKVVQETIQPAHVSLWLRMPQRHSEEPHHLEKPHTMEKDF